MKEQLLFNDIPGMPHLNYTREAILLAQKKYIRLMYFYRDTLTKLQQMYLPLFYNIEMKFSGLFSLCAQLKDSNSGKIMGKHWCLGGLHESGLQIEWSLDFRGQSHQMSQI